MPLDLDATRLRFPGLQTDWVLLDNAGGSQILATAADRIRECLLTSHVQVGGTYAASKLVGERVASAMAALARWINADPSELLVGPSTTQILQNLSLAMAPLFKPGDEVVVTDVDHESNIGPWTRLADRGVQVKVWKLRRESLELHADDLARLVTKRTRLVAFAQVSNVLGHVNPVHQAVKLAHDAGAWALLDGVAFAPHRKVDVRALDADFYVLSLYKVFGPHQALLYGRRDLLARLASINHDFLPADKFPAKLQPGGMNFELVAGSGAVPDYFDSTSYDAIAEHETALAHRVLSFLRSKRNVRIIGRPTADRDRMPTISFVVDGRDASSIPPLTDPAKVGIKCGDFYARRLCDALGLTARGGVVRASMVHYNTLGEMDRLCAALDVALGA